MSTYSLRDPNAPTIDKDPNAVLDYTWDWSEWLGSDTINLAEVTVDTTLVLHSTTRDGAKVTAFIGGGAGSSGAARRVTCKVTTNNVPIPRVEFRTIHLNITPR